MACTARRWEGRIAEPNCRSYCGQCWRRTSARDTTGGRLLSFEVLVEFAQGRLGACLADSRQVSVDDGGVQCVMAEVAADLEQGNAFFQQMSGVTVAQSVSGRDRIDAAGGASHPVGGLDATLAHRPGALVHRLA